MKKILSILMALTLIVLFTLTWYSSRKTEQLFTAQINAFNQTAPGLIKVDLQEYQRKLFTSTAQTALQIQGQDKIIFIHQIRHFVWGIKMTTILANNSDLANAITTTIPLNQLPIITDISFLGASKSTLELPQLSFQDDSGKLKMTGFSASWDLNADLTMGGFTCQLENLQRQQDNQNELNLTNLKISSQMTDLQDIPLGEGTLQVENLQLLEHGKPAIEFQNIQYRGQTDLTQKLFSNTAELNFDQLSLADETLRDGRLKLILSGIDTELLHSLQQTAKQLQLKALNQQGNPFELQLQLLGLYTQLLNSGITLHLEDLSVKSGEDKISGNGVLTLLNESSADGSLFSLANIQTNFQLDIDRGAFVTAYRLFNNLRSNGGNHQNPAVLAEQAEQIAGGLVQKGIFVQQGGDKFRVGFSWIKGQGTLNGNPFQRLNR
ncbi:MAG: DUF945 family protein [Desulfuromusa sp.]